MDTYIRYLIDLYDKYSSYINWTNVLIFFIVIFVLNIIKMVLILIRTKLVSRRKVLYTNVKSGKKVLIVGDSTAVGTGASDPRYTLAGRLANDFPNSTIRNIAVNGSLTRDILSQLKKIRDDAFDMIIISTGGNDVWNYTTLRSLERDLRKVLDKAKEMSGHRVILLFFDNSGSAPFFPSIIRRILLKRTAKVEQVFHNVAMECAVPYIYLYSNPRNNPFIDDPRKYFALDGLHPNDDGYKLWYNQMWYQMVKNGYVFDEGKPDIL